MSSRGPSAVPFGGVADAPRGPIRRPPLGAGHARRRRGFVAALSRFAATRAGTLVAAIVALFFFVCACVALGGWRMGGGNKPQGSAVTSAVRIGLVDADFEGGAGGGDGAGQEAAVAPLTESPPPRPDSFVPSDHTIVPREELVAIGGVAVPKAYRRWDRDYTSFDGGRGAAVADRRFTVSEMVAAMAAVGALDGALSEAFVFSHNTVALLTRIATSQPLHRSVGSAAGWQLDAASEASFGTPDMDSELKYTLASARKRWAGATDVEVDAAYHQTLRHPFDAVDFAGNPSQARCAARRSYVPQGFAATPVYGAAGKLEHAWEGYDVGLHRHRLHQDRTSGYCLDEEWGEAAGSVAGAPFNPLGEHRLMAALGCAIHYEPDEEVPEDVESMSREEALASLSTRRAMTTTMSPGDPLSLTHAVVNAAKGGGLLSAPLRDLYDVIVTSPSKRRALERSLHTATAHLLMRIEALRGVQSVEGGGGDAEALAELPQQATTHNWNRFPLKLRPEGGNEAPHTFVATPFMTMRQAFGRCVLSLAHAPSAGSFHKTLSFGSFPLTAAVKVRHLWGLATASGRAYASAPSADGRGRGAAAMQFPSHVFTALAFTEMLLQHSFITQEWGPIDHSQAVLEGGRGRAAGGAPAKGRERLSLYDNSATIARANSGALWRVALYPHVAKLREAAEAVMASMDAAGNNTVPYAFVLRDSDSTIFDFAALASEASEAVATLYPPINFGESGDDGPSRFAAAERYGPGGFGTPLSPLPTSLIITPVPYLSSAGAAAEVGAAYCLAETPPPLVTDPSGNNAAAMGSGGALRGDVNGIYSERARFHRRIGGDGGDGEGHVAFKVPEGAGDAPPAPANAREAQLALIEAAHAAALCDDGLAAASLLFQLWRMETLVASKGCADEACQLMATANLALLRGAMAGEGVTVPLLLRRLAVAAGVGTHRLRHQIHNDNEDAHWERPHSVSLASLCSGDAAARLRSLVGMARPHDSGLAGAPPPPAKKGAPPMDAILRWFDSHVYPYFADQHRRTLAPILRLPRRLLSSTSASEGDGPALNGAPRDSSAAPFVSMVPLHSDALAFVDVGGPSDAFARDVWAHVRIPTRRFVEGPRRAAMGRLGQCITDLNTVDSEVAGQRASVLKGRWRGNISLIVRNRTQHQRDEEDGIGGGEDGRHKTDAPQQYAVRCEGIGREEQTPLASPAGDMGSLVVALASQALFPRPGSSIRSKRVTSTSSTHQGGADVKHRATLATWRQRGEAALHGSIVPRIGLYEALRRYGSARDQSAGPIAPFTFHHYLIGGASSAVTALSRAALLKRAVEGPPPPTTTRATTPFPAPWEGGEEVDGNAQPFPPPPLKKKDGDDGRAMMGASLQQTEVHVDAQEEVAPSSARALFVPMHDGGILTEGSGDKKLTTTAVLLRDLCRQPPADERCYLTFPHAHDELQSVCDAGVSVGSGAASGDGAAALLAVAAHSYRREKEEAHKQQRLEARDRGEDVADFPLSLSHGASCLDGRDFGRSDFSGGASPFAAAEGTHPGDANAANTNVDSDEGAHAAIMADIEAAAHPPKALWRHPIPTVSTDDAMLGWPHRRASRANLHAMRSASTVVDARELGEGDGAAAVYSSALTSQALLLADRVEAAAAAAHTNLRAVAVSKAKPFVPFVEPNSAKYRMASLSPSASLAAACANDGEEARQACQRAPPLPVFISAERAAWAILSGIVERTEENSCPKYRGLCTAETAALSVAASLRLVPGYAHIADMRRMISESRRRRRAADGSDGLTSEEAVALLSQLQQKAASSALLSALSTVASQAYVVRVTEPPPPLGASDGVGKGTRNRAFHRMILNCGAARFMGFAPSASHTSASGGDGTEGAEESLLEAVGAPISRPRLIIHNGYDLTPSANALRYEGTSLHVEACGMAPPREGGGDGSGGNSGAQLTYEGAMRSMGYLPYHDPAALSVASGGGNGLGAGRYTAGLPPQSMAHGGLHQHQHANANGNGAAALAESFSGLTVVWVLNGYAHYCPMCS